MVLWAAVAQPGPRVRYTINEQWLFDGQLVNLPHTWNALDAFDKAKPYRRGVGTYRKTLTLPPQLRGKRVFLYFEGANQVADVYVNDRHAGQHIGGYTAFAFDVSDLISFDKANEIAVRVDNSHNPDIPPLNADFTFYGGIYRDVWLIATSPAHFDVTDRASPGVFVSADQRGVVRIRGNVVDESGAKLRVATTIIDDSGAVVASVTTSVRAGSFEQTTKPIENPHLWSPASPYLYRVRTELYAGNDLADSIENPLGIRWFGVDAQNGFTLNGRPLRLFGTNRHQDYEGLGNALTNDLHRRDVRLVKETGFNFLRLAHYPQDPAVLEEADRSGLVIWEEIPIVNLIGTSAAFADNSERMLVEMIRQHFNHPSIFFWGYMNEVLLTKPDPLPDRYDERVVELAKRLEKRAHDEDPTRQTVMALSRDEVNDDHGLGDIPNILGMNLYFGWYYDDFAALGDFLDRIHRQHPKRALMVSEYGAGSDERVHSLKPKAFDFSSEYAQEFHRASFPQLESRRYIAGTAVWNQFDFGSASRQDTKFGINSKGLYFYDRTPKDSAFYYEAALLERPVLKIAREWNERAGSRAEDRVQPVWVYTNQPEVELFVNGRSVGSRKPVNRSVRWEVELSNGENRIVARAESREDAITIDYEDRTGSQSFAVNAGSDYAYVDRSHVCWEPDRGYTGGEGTLTHHRIFATDEDPLYQASREGVERYHFDVVDGAYEVRLGFAEGKDDAKRVFSVSINGRELLPDFKPPAYTAVERSFVVDAANGSGITVEFVVTSGKTLISAVRIRPATCTP